jgi:hypothetical protein
MVLSVRTRIAFELYPTFSDGSSVGAGAELMDAALALRTGTEIDFMA